MSAQKAAKRQPGRMLRRMPEGDLNALAVKRAGEYVEQRMKGGTDATRHLVLNSVAHGFWMGARFAEKTYREHLHHVVPWLRPLDRYPEAWIERHAKKASDQYMRSKNFSPLNSGEKALVKATVMVGFEGGYRWRSECCR